MGAMATGPPTTAATPPPPLGPASPAAAQQRQLLGQRAMPQQQAGAGSSSVAPGALPEGVPPQLAAAMAAQQQLSSSRWQRRSSARPGPSCRRSPRPAGPQPHLLKLPPWLQEVAPMAPGGGAGDPGGTSAGCKDGRDGPSPAAAAAPDASSGPDSRWPGAAGSPCGSSGSVRPSGRFSSSPPTITAGSTHLHSPLTPITASNARRFESNLAGAPSLRTHTQLLHCTSHDLQPLFSAPSPSRLFSPETSSSASCSCSSSSSSSLSCLWVNAPHQPRMLPPEPRAFSWQQPPDQ